MLAETHVYPVRHVWSCFCTYDVQTDTSSPVKQIEDWINTNKVCRHTMLSALSNDMFDVYCSYKEAKEIWDSLILKYTAEDIVR